MSISRHLENFNTPAKSTVRSLLTLCRKEYDCSAGNDFASNEQQNTSIIQYHTRVRSMIWSEDDSQGQCACVVYRVQGKYQPSELNYSAKKGTLSEVILRKTLSSLLIGKRRGRYRIQKLLFNFSFLKKYYVIISFTYILGVVSENLHQRAHGLVIRRINTL